MAVEIINEPAQVNIKIAGEEVFGISKYRVTAQREVVPIESYDAPIEKSYPKQSVRYNISLFGIIGASFDLFSLSDFELEVSFGTAGAKYYGCQWEKVEKSVEGGSVALSASIVSYKRGDLSGT